MIERKKRMKNSKRFSDEQIKSLEKIFKVEAKLEPRKKLQMARELGLQPRQVAIWFQNKRARWKSKQLEHEYRSLKTDYDELNSRFESLQNEKHSLLIQLEKLRDQLNMSGEGRREIKDTVEGNSAESCSETGQLKFHELKSKLSSISGGVEQLDMHMYSDDEFLAEREGRAEFCNLSTERLSSFELDDSLLDQQCATPPTWWDFWT